jgi:hypothetical protein
MKEMEKLTTDGVKDVAKKAISRKDAIKKAGYMAVSAATMMILLNSQAEAHSSPAPPPPTGGGGGSPTGGGGIWKK